MAADDNKPRTQGRLRKIAVGFVVVSGLVLVAGTAAAASGQFEKLAKRLAELRSEVDSLTSKVETKKNRLKSRLRSIQRQRSDLELQIEKENMRVKRLRKSIADRKEKLQKHQTNAKELKPAVAEAIAEVRTGVETGPPFKRSERSKELDKLDSQMNEGLLSPQKVTSRLWQFVEDELRLSRENGLYSQVIEVEGNEVLADVARIGMVALYFKTDDGRVGVARRSENGEGAWSWQVLSGEKQKRRIEKLFESFKKNIRVGYFVMPNGLRGIERLGEEGK